MNFAGAFQKSRNFLRSIRSSLPPKVQELSVDDIKITDENTEIILESYRQANQYARASYEGFYKHATISFTFNALLLTVFSFVLRDSAAIPQAASAVNLMDTVLLGLTSLGVVFNIGALVAFRTSWRAWYRMHYLIYMFEDANAGNKILPVQKAINENRKFPGPVYLLTSIFYILWILTWACIFLYI